MKKELLTLSSQCDSLPISVAIFEPETEIKGIVQLAHGMAEHKERYFAFMEFLASKGYVAIINDHRGHGASVKSQEDLGYFYDETTEYVVEDIHQITTYVKDRFPGKPVYLFGHSMGSLIVRVYLKKYDDQIEKLIACGAPPKNPAVGAAKIIIKVLTALKGDRHRSKLMYNLSVGGFNKAMKNPRTECDWLSVNTDNVDRYLQDPLCGYGFTLNGYKNLMGVMEECFSPEGWKMKNKEMPILFIAGSEDPAITGKKEWLASQDFLKKMGYTNVSGKMYEGVRHEILNEDIKEQVYQDVVDFID